MSIPVRHLFPLLLLLMLPACAGGFTLASSAIEGQVTEEGTNQPIPGAIVVARWQETRTSFVHSQTVCVHVESAITDETGHYRLPAYKGRPPTLLDGYKIGYENTLSQTRREPNFNDFQLRLFAGSRGERLEYLSRAAVSCSHEREIEIKLLPLYKALYEEAKSIAFTKEEKLKALYRLRDVERLELGSDKAWGNFRRREQELK